MKVAELMRTQVRTVGVNDTLADAIATLVDADVSALPVLDESRGPVGVVTGRDALAATLEHYRGRDGNRGLDAVPVAAFMSAWPAAVAPDTRVAEAARMMSYLDLKRLFVVDGNAVVGVLSQTDIVDALATARYEPTG